MGEVRERGGNGQGEGKKHGNQQGKQPGGVQERVQWKLCPSITWKAV
jgi:hypothetical protein